MKQLSLIVLVLSFAITTPVIAADKDGGFVSQGRPSCGEWINKGKDGSWGRTIYTAWVAGYITAYNIHKPDVYNILGSTDMESVLLWMDKYCRENPLNTSDDGMETLIDELWPNRKRTADD